MRRLAASLFVAALVSGASASSALAADTSIPDLSTPAVSSQLRLSGTLSGPFGLVEETSVFARSTTNSLITNRRGVAAGAGGSFSGFSDLGGSIVGSPSSVPFHGSTLEGSTFVFVRGSDDNVRFQRVTLGAASGFQVLPGLKVASRVTAITVGSTISVFARGKPDNLGYVNVFSQGRWLGWRNLGSQTLSSDLSPVLVGNDPRRVLVFARGSDNAAHVTRVDPLDPSADSPGWENLGGQFASNITPAVLERRAAGTLSRTDPGERAVFIFARGSNNALYLNRAQDESRLIPRFSGFRYVDGGLTGDIGAPAFTSGNQLTLAVRGNPDTSLYTYTINYDGSDRGFVFIDGGLASNPVVVILADQLGFPAGVTEVYVRATDNALYVYRLTNGGGNGGFSFLGGQLG